MRGARHTIGRLTRAAGRVFVLIVTISGCVVGAGEPKPGSPPHHRVPGFANPNSTFARPSFWTVQQFRLARLWRAVAGGRPMPVFPRVGNDGAALRGAHTGATLTWIGHATLLIQLDGVNVLTDPIWSERASPIAFAGPRRLTAPGVRFDDLPPIHAVVISHNHYDHLDRATVKRLARAHRPVFLVPLGNKASFTALGIDNVHELDWWEERRVGEVTITCVPAQHWSARTPWDTDTRLWSGWALAGRGGRAFFAGDTGYYDGLREIRTRLGPIDVAAVSIAAYEPPRMMRHTHTTPEEALRIFDAVDARIFVAMHWGTFDLGDEPLDEPPQRLEAEARRRGLGPDRVWILRHGETRRW